MYRLAICEDESCQLEALCSLCGDILQQMEIPHEITAFASADELAAALKSGAQFNLLCLDILMDEQTGMELASELRTWDDHTSIIFITCSTEYLLDGYSVRPIQYLLKPVQQEALAKAIRTDLRLHYQPQTISLTIKGKTYIMTLADIRYIESRNHGCVSFMEKEDLFLQMHLSEIETLLPASQFARCHNSYLVNLMQIKSVNSREVQLQNGYRLPIGRRYAKEFQSKFVRHLNCSEI